MSKGELWMGHHSVQSWNEAAKWDDYLLAIESVLGDRLAKLDDKDPVRRKVNAASGEGQFIVQFGEREDSRWLWGIFEKSKIQFQIDHYKLGADSFGRPRDNSITFYIPEKMTVGPGVRKLIDLFRLTNARLGVFYAFADFKSVICSKKPSTPSLDLSRELLGVFWLTYFSSRYCEFFGRDRVSSLEQASEEPAGGITLQLAETPGQISEGQRLILEKKLGSESFAGTGDKKARGQYALTLEQLSSATEI